MTIASDTSQATQAEEPAAQSTVHPEQVTTANDGLRSKGKLEVTPEQKEGRELVKDAYVNVAEVVFNWSKQLDDIQGNAVRAMTNMTGLTHPDHPLHKEGEDGISVYMATAHDGRQRLVFSLTQIQYIQYYIRKLRLADPSYIDYLAAVEVAGENGEKPSEPPLDPSENVPVPLPGPWYKASEFASIEPINIPSQQALKKMIKDTQKQNKQIEKKLLHMQPETLTPQEKSRAEADEDNNTPGPGLRRTGQKQKEQKPIPPPREEGTGWGGFPIVSGQEHVEAPAVELPWQESGTNDVKEELKSAEPDTEKVKDGGNKDAGQEKASAGASVSGEEQAMKKEGDLLAPPALEVEDAGSTDGSETGGDDLANQLNKLNAFTREMVKPDEDPEDASGAVDKATAEKEDGPMDVAEQYHYDAQQAFVLAADGGLNLALTARRAMEYAANGVPEPMSEDGETPEQICAPEVGRSLFFALDLTTWEDDENVVLEVGWAATWFQEVLVVDDKDEKVSMQGANGSQDRDQTSFEQITEYGHIMSVGDHLLDKRNGKVKPDNRRAFAFGDSIPLATKDVMSHLKKKLFDAAARAGGGPVYLLLHTADSDLDELKKLGWRTGGWETELRPEGWDFPSYGCEDGIGKVFIIDTARLFGGIENDTSIRPASNKTRKSLEEVAMIMFGHIEGQEPEACGNAGNDAAYCLKVFTGIVTGLPLEALRVEYQAAQMSAAVNRSVAEADSGETEVDVLPTVTISSNKKPQADDKDAMDGDKLSHDTSSRSARATIPESTAAATAATGSDIPKTPPSDNEVAAAEGKPSVRVAGSDEDDEDDSDDEFAIKGVWYTNDAGDDILLSEE